MKNYIQEGCIIDLVAPAAVASGAGVLVGSIFGVAQSDIASSASGPVCVCGVFDIAKDTSAPSQGAKIYWDNIAKKASTTSASNTLIGVATQAALTGDATCRVRLGIVA